MHGSFKQPLRVGAVNYLNSKPLIEGLEESLPRAELILDYPSRLADGLAAGDFDVALIPSIEVFRSEGYQIVSDACVATHGPVLSVKLFSRVPVSKIRRLALDEGSRTSAALVQILLAERHQIRPELEPLRLGQASASSTADAVLLIGDRAIHAPSESFSLIWDLGKEWTDWTGLPFVFAVWAMQRGTIHSALADKLTAARDLGVSRLRDIAEREAPRLEIEESVAFKYLTDNLCYRLGPAEKRGLEQFRAYASKLDFVGRQSVEWHLPGRHDESNKILECRNRS